MNNKVYHTLEFNKVRNLLSDCAFSQTAKERCAKLTPQTDRDCITRLQTQTADALSRIFADGELHFGGFTPIEDILQRLRIGGILNQTELLTIASLLEVAKRAVTYDRQKKNPDASDSLSDLFDGLNPISSLKNEITRCILSEEEIADDASPTLRTIRTKLRSMSNKIHAQLNGILNNPTTRSYLQEAVITMRNDRYCIPVKAEHKSNIQGLVHDQSASGSTYFIEPLAIVKLNNEQSELLSQERDEIQVILSTLSQSVLQNEDELAFNADTLCELDFIFAKATLAKKQNATCPLFNTDGIIRIRKARHPLLEPAKVVPIDIEIGETYQQLIVTGPNTGGKTVSLKTTGLLTLMGQSGLHIPAADRSMLSIYDEIYADIGDEQSIEHSLSTFSSHMVNIVAILQKANKKSLVLFDELCAGTDPTEGAALAIAILKELLQRGATTMATTHYSELKLYALSTEGVENGCCEFNVETLSPTYRLLIGIPGKSNAFAISSKLGLPETIIQNASETITQDEQDFEQTIADLEASRKLIEEEQLQIKQYKKEIEQLKQKLEEKQSRLEQSREKILQDANEEARKILQDAKDLADQTIRNFNKYGQGSAPMAQMEKERSALGKKLKDNNQKLTLSKNKTTPTHTPPKKLRIGDSVKVVSLNLKGTVHTLPNAKGELYVQMGILRSLVSQNDLILLEDDNGYTTGKSRTNMGKIKQTKSSYVSTEIKLIGMTTDEAISKLDKYLDDAYIAHLPSVRIVHGKGTGALRKAVHMHLKQLKYVKAFHLGEFGEGDAGVTIAEFE